jgi:hypothetical protein
MWRLEGKHNGCRRETHRVFRLFDTFEGMSAPTDDDRTPQFGGVSAGRSETIWAYSPMSEVRQNFWVGYPSTQIKFI